jgi:site-specific DNA-methyltransferase (adenine-specific)
MAYRLIKGDCLDVMPLLEAGSIDAIITDLPYGTTACAWDEVIPFAEMWKEVKRVLKSDGVFVTTASQPFTSALIMSNPSWFKYEWIWDKRLAGNAMNSNYQPLKIHENIVVFSAKGHTYNPQMRRGRLRTKLTNTTWKSTFGTQQSTATKNDTYKPTSILDFSVPRVGREHPTQKSVDLFRYLVRTYTNEGETVLDFCMGIGTTIEAAIAEGRCSIGIEREHEYFLIAESNVKSAVLQPNFFTPSNNRLNLGIVGSPTQKALFTDEADTAT